MANQKSLHKGLCKFCGHNRFTWDLQEHKCTCQKCGKVWFVMSPDWTLTNLSDALLAEKGEVYISYEEPEPAGVT